MKITDSNPIRSSSSSATKKKSSIGGTSFSSLLDDADGVEAKVAASNIAATSFDVVLATQGFPEEQERRQKAVKQANNALDQLESLRRTLLMGNVPAYILRNLSNICAEHRERLADPVLNAVLDDIELRAAVELAKLEKARMV